MDGVSAPGTVMDAPFETELPTFFIGVTVPTVRLPTVVRPYKDGPPGDGAGPTTPSSKLAEGSLNAVRASTLSRASVQPSFHAGRS